MRRWSMAGSVAAVAALGVVTALGTPALGRADSCTDAMNGGPLPLGSGACADVLAQEARWLTAITSGDRDTVESILGADFKHITSEGKLLDRAQEIATIVPLPLIMNPTEQLVDMSGDTAVIHGLNTVTQNGRVVSRERFTDVFILQNGEWMALSAQETAM